MAVISPRELSNYDLFMAYDGVAKGLIIHRTEGGAVSWFPGLAPALQPQFQTGDWGYELTPSETDIAFSWQDLSGGAGFIDDPDGSITPGPRKYSYSRGVDASEGTRLYLSPLGVADTVVAAAPVKTIETSLGTFQIAGQFIYELTTQPGVWTQRNDLGSGAYTDIIEYKGTLFAAAGNTASYKYSTDGITWVAYSDATVNALYFATRDDVLWHVTSGSQVANNQAGTAQNGGTAWSAADNVGHSGETVRGMLEIDNNLYVFKEEGIYKYTGTATEDVWLGGAKMRRTTNGFGPYLWGDQRTYVPYGDRLMRFDHVTPGIDFIFPTNKMRGHPEVNGQIASITGDNRWLYVVIQNHNGDFYIMKGNPYHNNGDGEWHTYMYLGATSCQSIDYMGANAVNPSTNNPSLIYGSGSASAHVILPRVGWRPEDDSNYAFTTVGTLYGSNVGFGALAFSKFLNGGSVTGLNLSDTETIRLSYETEDSGIPVSLITATASGTTRESLDTVVEFERVRPVIRLLTGASTTGPVGVAVVLHATPNPPRRHQWTFMVDVGNALEMLGGGESPYSGQELEQFLFGSVTKRATLTDRNGREFFIKVNTVAGISAGDVGAVGQAQGS